MTKIHIVFILLLTLISFSETTRAQNGSVCGNPSERGCVGQYDDFQPHDLIFNTGRAALGTGTRHESSEFYAVILESVAARHKSPHDCRFVSETKRRAAQKLFPNNKVFASRSFCRGIVVLYDNANENFNFMAVYAGANEKQAAAVLAKAKKKYPRANVRRMKVILDFSDE